MLKFLRFEDSFMDFQKFHGPLDRGTAFSGQLSGQGHTDSRVHCRIGGNWFAALLIEPVGSTFISWLLHNRNASVRRLVKRSIRVVRNGEIP